MSGLLLQHFFIGGVSGMLATFIIQPIDTFKVQIQVISEIQGKTGNKKKGMFQILDNIFREKGVAVLYRGLGTAMLRQLFYASARLGSYNWAVDKFKQNGFHVGAAQKVGLSMASGIFGAIVGNPFDVALIRRQATVTTGQPAYTSTIHAFRSIIREEGIFGLWRGLEITMLRVLLINVGQLAGNEIIADLIRPLFAANSQLIPNISALLASLLTSFLSLPADNIKVKLQKQTPDNLLYKGILDCFFKTIQRQGFTRLWVGFPVYLIRGAPHSFILIRAQQYIKKWLMDQE